MTNETPSRRAFLYGLGVVSVLPALPAASKTAPEYVATPGSIDVFMTHGGCRFRAQSLESCCPVSLTLDRSGSRLFAVNEVCEYKGLPRGSVECYAIEPRTGLLRFVNRQALSLSATMPRHLAISPDGRTLVVAVYGGGAYNVLPVDMNGRVGIVSQVVKEIGCGSHAELQRSAHPHSVVFDPSGEFLIGTDFGSDRLNVFSFERGGISCIQRMNVPPGSGPGKLWMNEDGSRLVVRHELSSRLGYYRFDMKTGLLS